ncbi:HAD-IIIA family hydrolase [Candidatus Uhrbacteria bacterium]|nr:HAD-IIIA family hydrolase [Candidatus Uhrbacteria bacterium]
MLYIFDADGTLTPQRDGSCGDFDFKLLPGRAEKCEELREAGHQLVIASNQSPKRDSAAIHEQLNWTGSKIGAITYRYATGKNGGFPKKPSPDILVGLMRELRYTPAQTVFVGDQETDRQAAEAAGVQFVHTDDFW